MSETKAQPATLSVVEETPQKPKSHWLLTALKVGGIVLAIVIVAQLLGAFFGFSKSSAFKNVSQAFGNATAALAWATSHWYLFLAGWLILPFVPAAGKWVAKKMSEAKKANDDGTLTDDGLDAVSDAVVAQQAAENASEASTPEERQEWEAKQADATEAFHDADAEAKDSAEDFMGDNGINVPDAAAAVQIRQYRPGFGYPVQLGLPFRPEPPQVHR